jgi:hypothetical protein
MKLFTKYMTRNDCYTAGRKITPKGIMVHSTAVPGVMAAEWFSRWNKSYKAGEINRQVCVHAFVDDKEVWQYLPWDHRGWHAGGAANNTHIGFEICEPAGFSYKSGSVMVGYDAAKQEDYFRKAWQNAVELCVMLCKKYGLNENDIICHSEGYKLGIASNHADVMHWFPKHGENMDTFRKAVKKALENSTDTNTDIGIGDMVEFKDSVKNYYPGSVEVPTWVKNDYYHRVTQTLYKGKPVIKGGKECVLLGKKVKKSGSQEIAGINTWVAKENLDLVEFLRVIRNLLMRVRQAVNTRYTSNLRFDFMKRQLKDVTDLLIQNQNVYQILTQKGFSMPGFSKDSVDSEIKKATLIVNNINLKEKIHKLEDNPLFKGCIDNVLEIVVGNPAIDLDSIITDIWSNNSSTVIKALLSIGDYSVIIGYSQLGARKYFGGDGEWNIILTRTTNESQKIKEILKEFICKYITIKGSTSDFFYRNMMV